MRILNAHSLTAAGRIPPETAELNLSERDSALVITAGPEAPELSVGQWLQDDTDPGAGIVWRVRTADENAGVGTRTYTLEHLIRSLADKILPNEVKSTAMGGTAAGCTARQAITYVLGKQSDWTLGDFDYDSVSNPYQFSGETLLAAIETVSASLEDPVWSYDFTVYPFRLSITRESSAAACEMRAGRNITTLRTTVDRSRLYTRLYPVGKNNLKLDSPGYVEQNTATWGVIERTETDQSKRTKAQLEAWARARLARHCDPVVTVQISGADLSAATGEPLDRLVIGRKCRVPLPEAGTVILEKITKLSYRDKVRDPESVTVTLANNPEDVQSIIRQDRAGGGGARRTDAEVNEENMLVIGDIESGLYTRITQTASELRREAHDEAESMRTFVIQTASAVLQIAENDVDSLRTVVEQTASQWSASIEQVAGSDGRVTAASIAVSINNQTGQGKVLLHGDQIDLDGYVTTISLSANSYIGADTIEAKDVFYMHSGYLEYGDHYSAIPCNEDLEDEKVVKNLSLTRSGNTYTLSWQEYDGTQHTETFSRATTLGGAWSSGKLTVTASPQGETFERTLSQDSSGATWSGSTVTVPVKAVYGSQGQYNEPTGWGVTISVASKLTTTTVTPTSSQQTVTPPTGYIGFSAVTVEAGGGSVPPSSHIQVESGGHYAPSYSAGGTQITSWVSTIRTAVNNSGYFYFDAWLSDNPSDKKRYYIKF